MNRKSTVAACLVTAAMLVGVTAATASAKQPDTPFTNFPPFSNLCAKVDGSYQAALDATGRPVTLSCTAAPSTSLGINRQLVNACAQVAEKYGLGNEFLVFSFPNIVQCNLQ